MAQTIQTDISSDFVKKITDLPPELILYIFKFVDIDSVLNLYSTCRYFNTLTLSFRWQKPFCVINKYDLLMLKLFQFMNVIIDPNLDIFLLNRLDTTKNINNLYIINHNSSSSCKSCQNYDFDGVKIVMKLVGKNSDNIVFYNMNNYDNFKSFLRKRVNYYYLNNDATACQGIKKFNANIYKDSVKDYEVTFDNVYGKIMNYVATNKKNVIKYVKVNII